MKKHQVDHVTVAPHVQEATVDQLLANMASQYNAIQSLTLTLQVTGSQGGEKTGEVKEFPTVSGFLFLRKPADLRLQLRPPIVSIPIFDMVSNGKDFEVYIPTEKQEYLGSEQQTSAPLPGFRGCVQRSYGMRCLSRHSPRVNT